MTVVSARILVLEDDPALSEILGEELRGRGHSVSLVDGVVRAREALKASEFDVALLDLMLPDGSGLDVLRTVAEEGLDTQAIMFTGYAAVATAIEAMKLGAYDYLTKPVRVEELELLVVKAAEKAALRRENFSLRARLQRQESGASGFVAEDPAMKAMLATIDRVARTDLPVLVQGESGTGKELVARAVHKASERQGEAFIAVNCAAVAEGLLESELFGHEKGAFTGAITRKPGMFELAERGVLFLDEIGEIGPSVQAKLLRAVETREYYRVGGTRPSRADVRIVSASNRDLKKASQAGAFREDLYFRLNGVTLTLPPLRERRSEIPLLVRHFLDRFGGQKKTLTKKALETLHSYNWPGNVRELQMVIRRAVALAPSDTLDVSDLPLDLRSGEGSSPLRPGMTLAEVEAAYIQEVLKENQGHRGRTARALGIDVKTLYNKLGPQKKEGAKAD